jgi:nitrous oxide reductase
MKKTVNRRKFLKGSALAATATAAGNITAPSIVIRNSSLFAI